MKVNKDVGKKPQSGKNQHTNGVEHTGRKTQAKETIQKKTQLNHKPTSAHKSDIDLD
jgi:hypothetical protein